MQPALHDPDEDPTAERRSISLNCRVTPTMRAKVNEAAEWAGVILGDWLRAVVGSALEEYERLRYGPDEDLQPERDPVGINPVESSIDYERRVRAAAADMVSSDASRLVAPVVPTETPRKNYRFEDPKDCPHLPTDRRAGGRCAGCGGNIGRYLKWGRTQ